ncbi:hypothetical protein ACA910_002546 [Epithemia clementina (nom. ined.)]
MASSGGLTLVLVAFQLMLLSRYQVSAEDLLVSYVLEPFIVQSIFDADVPAVEFLTDSDIQVRTSISDDTLHGSSSLRIDYKNEAPQSPQKFTVQSFLPNSQVFIGHGARQLSFSYKNSIPSIEDARDYSIQWKVTLFDSADCEQSCSNTMNLEAWEYIGDLLEPLGDYWKTMSLPLNSSDEWQLASSSGNDILDLDMLKGWRIDLFLPETSNHTEALFISQLALEGGGELLGAAFHAESWENALEHDVVLATYHTSNISKASSSQRINDGQFYVDYLVEQTETWGGFVQYDFSFPGRAYCNLSKAEAVKIDFHTIKAASVPDRAHLRLTLTDASNCKENCGFLSPNVENYYSFHFILDEADKQGSSSVELKGDNDSASPFWRTGWFGSVGNNVLDKSFVKGFKIEISMDSQGKIGSFISGAFALGQITALAEYDPHDIDVSSCMVDTDIIFRTDNYTSYKRVEFLNLAECCDSCAGDDNCNFAFSDGRDCFKTDYVDPKSIALASGENKKAVSFIKKSQGDFCDVCDCIGSDSTIDCRGRDLILLPGIFNPDKQVASVSGLPSWLPRVLDLRENPRLALMGSDALSMVSSIENLYLPSNMVHISRAAIKSLPQLKSVQFDDPVQLNNVVLDSSSAFSSICCGLGETIPLSDSLPTTSLTFCEMQSNNPGIDAVYEDFIEYFDATLLEAITPSSDFMSEAAQDKNKCAEYCNIRSDCNYFSYDSRITNTEHICYLLENKGTPTRVCCKEEQYEDKDQTIPGWISGRVSRTRHKDDNARVLLSDSAANLVIDKSSEYKATYKVSLGSVPLRGAVWVEPKVTTTAGMEVVLFPKKIALYNNNTEGLIDVVVLNPEGLEKGGTIVVENRVDSCDTAFSIEDSDLSVFIEVVLEQDSKATMKFLWIAVGSSLFVIALISLFFLHLVEAKKKQADAVWRVQASEIQFSDPPKIIGSGSFGLVLLAEYRGTQVAVKRVIPPCRKRKCTTTGSMSVNNVDIFDRNEAERISNSLTQTSDVELGMQPVGENHDVNLHIASGAHQAKYWEKAFQYNKQADYAKLKNEFIEEMRHLSKLRHPNVTTVMGAVIGRKEEPMLIMEYMDHGSLYDLLQNTTVVLEGEHFLSLFRDIAQGVRFLHSAHPKVVHGDIKARNILVDSRLRAKVADFGLSGMKRLGATGTPYWMAPELLRRETTNTSQSDVYAFGILLYEVYSRKTPYEGENFASVLGQVVDKNINKRPPVPRGLPTEIERLMKKCWDGKPANRPSFMDIDIKFKSLRVAEVEHLTFVSTTRTKKGLIGSTDDLLEEIFPAHIAEALRNGDKVEPETRDEVTIVFSDIVGFTSLSSTMSPIQVSDMLDRLYTKMDEMSARHEIFKVETIGDSWMGVANLSKDQPDHASRIADFAIDAIRAARETWVDPSAPSLGHLNLRVGMHSGPVVANVVGSRNPRYCLFGDTVNTASRMESHSEAGRIQCSSITAKLLTYQTPLINLTPRGRIAVKGKGEMETFWVAEDLLAVHHDSAGLADEIKIAEHGETKQEGVDGVASMTRALKVELEPAGAAFPSKTVKFYDIPEQAPPSTTSIQ